jgi:hypothetical protein
MLILKSCIIPSVCFKIFYKWDGTLQIMSSGDFEDLIQNIEKKDAALVKKQDDYVEYLKNKPLCSPPEQAEFCIMFVGLLESKIKSKIKREINKKCTTYFNEFTSLIVRSNPHSFLLEDPLTTNSKDQLYPIEILNLVKIEGMEKFDINLGEFISLCWTYNSRNTIENMLSDLALVERFRYLELDGKLDLGNDLISEFIKQRNSTTHDVVQSEIRNAGFIQDKLREILDDMVLMITNALEVRRTTIDNFKSSKAEHVDLQMKWLSTILEDIESNSREKHRWNYSQWFKPASANSKPSQKQKQNIKKLKDDVDNIIVKIGESSNA